MISKQEKVFGFFLFLLDKKGFLWYHQINRIFIPKGWIAMIELNYHKSLEHLHVGCEKPRAYFIPYQSECAAKTGNRAESDRFVSLCGEWNFTYFASVNDLPDFTADDYIADWLQKVSCPIIRVDGTKPIEDNVEYILQVIDR